MEEKVILVDPNDIPIGETGKMEAHLNAMLHRAVSVFVFNSKNQMLLQKRASHKYHSPNLWTNTACTHPFPGESIDDAAIRRLKQEMGINLGSVKKVFHFTYKEKLDNGLTEYEFDHVFIGFSDEKPVPDPLEVSDYRYVDLNDLLKDIQDYPMKYTVWFRKIINRVAYAVKPV